MSGGGGVGREGRARREMIKNRVVQQVGGRCVFLLQTAHYTTTSPHSIGFHFSMPPHCAELDLFFSVSLSLLPLLQTTAADQSERWIDQVDVDSIVCCHWHRSDKVDFLRILLQYKHSTSLHCHQCVHPDIDLLGVHIPPDSTCQHE